MGQRLNILRRMIKGRVRGEHFDSNGVKIHYTVEGSGPPVLLIHGLTSNADALWRFPGTIDALKQRHRVIAMDARGHGFSEKPHDGAAYGVEMVEDAVRLLDHLGIARAHVGGYSMGAMITYKLLAMYPQRVISAAPCGAGRVENSEANLALFAAMRDSLIQRRDFRPLFETLEPGGRKPAALKLAAYNFFLRRTNDVAALGHLSGNFAALHVSDEELRANTVPAFTVIGSRDPLLAVVERMRGIMANHRVEVLPGHDHVTAFSSSRFVRAVAGFFAEQAALQGG